jgi:hypothetical protein
MKIKVGMHNILSFSSLGDVIAHSSYDNIRSLLNGQVQLKNVGWSYVGFITSITDMFLYNY